VIFRGGGPAGVQQVEAGRLGVSGTALQRRYGAAAASYYSRLSPTGAKYKAVPHSAMEHRALISPPTSSCGVPGTAPVHALPRHIPPEMSHTGAVLVVHLGQPQLLPRGLQ
jgi:hypothetical protein